MLSEEAFRDDEDVARAHRYVGRDVAILDQVVQADVEALLFAVHVSNQAGAIARREFGGAADGDHHVHQAHAVKEALHQLEGYQNVNLIYNKTREFPGIEETYDYHYG